MNNGLNPMRGYHTPQEMNRRINSMNTKYTPGPWATSKDATPEWHTQITVYAEASGNRVATVFETSANAQLIAAAPALLEACKAAISWLEVIPIEYRNRPHYPIAQLQQAIQLAESTDKVTQSVTKVTQPTKAEAEKSANPVWQALAHIMPTDKP